jgi:hypothetical protein
MRDASSEVVVWLRWWWEEEEKDERGRQGQHSAAIVEEVAE